MPDGYPFKSALTETHINHPHVRARDWFRENRALFDVCDRCGFARINVKHDNECAFEPVLEVVQ
jgi:hypothetical protein